MRGVGNVVSKCCFYSVVCCPECNYEYCGDCMSKEPIQDTKIIVRNLERLERLGYEVDVLRDMSVIVQFKYKSGGVMMFVRLMELMDNEIIEEVIIRFNGLLKEGEWKR